MDKTGQHTGIPRPGRDYPFNICMPTPEEIGLGARYLGLVVLALAVGTSSLTFHWIIEDNRAVLLFPEFASTVVYISDISCSQV